MQTNNEDDEYFNRNSHLKPIVLSDVCNLNNYT